MSGHLVAVETVEGTAYVAPEFVMVIHPIPAGDVAAMTLGFNARVALRFGDVLLALDSRGVLAASFGFKDPAARPVTPVLTGEADRRG